MGYHNAHVYLLDVESGETRNLTPDLDRSVDEVRFAGASNRMYIRYADRGQQKVALLTTGGRMNDVVTDLGSAGFGRPYASGSFSVAPNGTVAYTRGTPTAPAEVGVLGRGGRQRLARSNRSGGRDAAVDPAGRRGRGPDRPVPTRRWATGSCSTGCGPGASP